MNDFTKEELEFILKEFCYKQDRNKQPDISYEIAGKLQSMIDNYPEKKLCKLCGLPSHNIPCKVKKSITFTNSELTTLLLAYWGSAYCRDADTDLLYAKLEEITEAYDCDIPITNEGLND